MFEKKDLINQNTGESYTKYLYKFDDTDPIVGILFGHFAPFTGPNGHGRMVTALKNIGAESFLIATPDNNKPFDDEREMFNSHQRVEIIQAYLDSEGLDGEAIAYKMKRGGAKSQMGPLVALAAEKFGMNIRPVFCFGPDREDLAADVCNKFGEITDPTHCEYIVDYERGTSGTKVRQLIKANDVDGIVSETGYKPEVAEKLIKLRMENKGMGEFNEAYKMKEWEYIYGSTNPKAMTSVNVQFSDKDDANEFKDEVKDKFNIPKDVPKYQVVHGTTDSGNSVFVESFKKIYNESSTLLPLYNATEEVYDVQKAAERIYKERTGHQYRTNLYHFEGGNVFITFTSITGWRDVQALLSPIAEELSDEFDLDFEAGTCKYGGCIVVTPKKPGPYEDYFYEIYNGPSEVEE